MKKINKIICISFVCFLLCMIGINIFLSKQLIKKPAKEYRISLNRIYHDIDEFESLNNKYADSISDLSHEYTDIIQIYAIASASSKEEIDSFIQDKDESYVIYVTAKAYYKIIYDENLNKSGEYIMIINVLAIIMYLTLLLVLIYIRSRVLKPFNSLSELPYELSKGNLSIPLKENKDRYFGKFMWGMDMLRENLEDNKRKELELQKEKKTLLLSLSHDIKTPLSAIKLYSKALTKNLYNDENKKREIADNINLKADEIESYIAEIVKASNEDFLTFEVDIKEFYISEVLDFINDYYRDKMELNQISFSVGKFNNCIVMGDSARLTEVVQNVIENAIKYGDGNEISVSSERDDESFIICIRNTGCMLDKRELPHIFDSFFRGSNTEKKPGSGLGLYICRKLMHIMEGEITAEIIDKYMIIKIYIRLA